MRNDKKKNLYQNVTFIKYFILPGNYPVTRKRESGKISLISGSIRKKGVAFI